MDDRRSTMIKMAAGMAATSLISVSTKVTARELPMKKILMHHILFWLKDPTNNDAKKELEIGLQALAKIPQIQSYHIGTPRESTPDVVDDSFSYSFLAFFRNEENQHIYDTHPIHLKFKEDCEHLWEKVIVYDAIS